uniref:Coiled-coil domain-containing protein n=1 Tax=Scophthalmus maximus TaxID=52904 RepID=A0A8D3ALZ7_SCOMX
MLCDTDVLLSSVVSVRQCFAVLEDGVLAHSLQEQESEYSVQFMLRELLSGLLWVFIFSHKFSPLSVGFIVSRITQKKNQLVQNDIRVAKRLQDEEDEERSQQSAVVRQTFYGPHHRSRTSILDLGELTQVLQDEELARKLQDEEEMLLRSVRDPFYPEGDFRVAQVAQDEEIARFMQKQEIKSKRRSRELEGPSSWREHREMIGHHDRRAARDRQRLDSEGLPSPTEDCCPENLPPSPVSTLPPAQHIRNIAEELDPTFQSLAGSHAGLNDFLVEPTFIPPTKRQAEKPAGTKPKEKKENCKQQ